MRTRMSVCRKKARYASEAEAMAVAGQAPYALRPYRCDRCLQFHLTSRIKGKWQGQSKSDPKPGGPGSRQ